MIPQKFLRNLATNFGISDNEFEALSRAIEGESMDAIAQELGVSKDALQKRLGEVYKKFDIIGRGPGKLARLQQILISQYQQQVANFTNDASNVENPVKNVMAQTAASVDTTPETAIPLTARKTIAKTYRTDWGEAPDIPIFYGRSDQIATLKQWIVNDACRLVALVGMGGIGKTALAVRTIQEIEGEFDYCFWRSLKERPLMPNILVDLIQFLSPQPETDLPENTEQKISLLLKYLSDSRCLLVLDEVDSILQNSLSYQQGYENYANLFQQILTSSHQSCLLLTSWHLPEKLNHIKVLQLNGLDEASAQKIIYSAKRFSSGSDSSLFDELIQIYGGNPLLLKIVTANFADLFSGNLTQFIQQTTLVVQQILRDYLQKINADLTESENYLICWLALKSKPVSINDLKSNLAGAVEISELPSALESLIKQAILVKIEDGFILEREIKQYITHQLIAKYFNQLGHKKYLAGEFQTAKSYLIQAIKFNPDLAASRYNLGATYEQLQDLEKARIQYQIAAGFNNRGAYAAISNLARLEIISENIDAAISLIMPILEQVKDELVLAALHKNIGWAYFLKNRYDEAEVQLLKSLELNNLHPPTYYILAQVKEAQGNMPEALVYYEEFLKCERSGKKPQGVYWRLPELDVWKITARQRLNSFNN